VWVWLDRPRAALAALELWLTTFLPDSSHHLLAYAWATQAHLLGTLGEWAKAQRVLEHLLALEPLRAAHWFNLGFVRARQGMPEAAQSAFERALALAPALDAAWYGLGQALYQQGDLNRAAEAWEHQVRLQPLCPDGWEGLVRLYVQCGNLDQAALRLDKLKRFDPRRAMTLEPMLSFSATSVPWPTPVEST
jgi:tetratricopeptide (TPR) repeat protein